MTKILFLEDHTSVRQSLSMSLEEKDKDFKIFQAAAVDEAVNILQKENDISAAILDLSLGGTNYTIQSYGGVLTDYTPWQNSVKLKRI